MPLQPKKVRDTEALTHMDPFDESLLAPNRQCSAMSKRTGERCKNRPMRAQKTCRMHGANRKSKIAAAKRIANASGHAAAMLVEFMNDPKVELKQRVQIAQDLLTRAGLSGKTELHVDIDWTARVDAAVVNWAELEQLSDPNVIDAEVVDEYRPLDATLDTSERPKPHLERRRAQVENSVSKLHPKIAPNAADGPPPWVSSESGAQTAKRLADEHKRAAFSADKATGGLKARSRKKR